MSAKFEFGVFLSHDAMQARYTCMPSSCVRLCGVDVADVDLADIYIISLTKICFKSLLFSRRLGIHMTRHRVRSVKT